MVKKTETLSLITIFLVFSAATALFLTVYDLNLSEDNSKTGYSSSEYANISLKNIGFLNPEIEEYYDLRGYYKGCKPGYGYSIRPEGPGLGLIVFDSTLVGIRSFYGSERGHYPWTDQIKGQPIVFENGNKSNNYSIYTHTLFLTEPPTREECETGEWDEEKDKNNASIRYEDILDLNPGYTEVGLECEDCAAVDGYGIPKRCTEGKGHYVRPDSLPGHALYLYDGNLLAIEETWDEYLGWRPWADGGPDNILEKKYGNQLFYKQTLWLKQSNITQEKCLSENFNYSSLTAPYSSEYDDPLVHRAGNIPKIPE